MGAAGHCLFAKEGSYRREGRRRRWKKMRGNVNSDQE